MEFKVQIKKKPYEEIKCLMNNIEQLNGGKEIGAWLTGEWKGTILTLNEMIIPKQKVSGAEVDIDEMSMLDLMKEIGHEKCNTIKAQWHIHPFTKKGKASFSGVDDRQVDEMMEIKKNREIFCFLLSSCDEIVARVAVNFTVTLNGQTEILQEIFEDVDIEIEGETKDKTYLRLKERIDIVVEKQTKTLAYYQLPNGEIVPKTQYDYKKVEHDNTPYSIKCKNKFVNFRMTRDFYTYMITKRVPDVFDKPKIEYKNDMIMWQYDCETKEKAKVTAQQMELDLLEIYNDYFDDMAVREQVKMLKPYSINGYDYDFH